MNYFEEGPNTSKVCSLNLPQWCLLTEIQYKFIVWVWKQHPSCWIKEPNFARCQTVVGCSCKFYFTDVLRVVGFQIKSSWIFKDTYRNDYQWYCWPIGVVRRNIKKFFFGGGELKGGRIKMVPEKKSGSDGNFYACAKIRRFLQRWNFFLLLLLRYIIHLHLESNSISKQGPIF